MKKTISAVLSLVLLLSVLTVGAGASYKDVPQEHWAEAAINKWSDMDIIQGKDELFRPDDFITRGEFAVVMDRMMQYQRSEKNNYQDLEAGRFYTDAMLKSAAAKVFLGDGGYMNPTKSITRQEAFVVLARVMGIDPVQGDTSAILASIDFKDETSVGEWALPSVAALVNANVIGGKNGYILPQASITRAECMAILDRSFQTIIATGGMVSKDIKGSVIVNTPGVELKNMKITGDLIVAQGVGEGELTLDGVVVTGKVIIRGGSDSIIIKGATRLNIVVVERLDGAVTFKEIGRAHV